MTKLYETETDKVRQGETRRMTPVLVTSTAIAGLLLSAMVLAAPF